MIGLGAEMKCKRAQQAIRQCIAHARRQTQPCLVARVSPPICILASGLLRQLLAATPSREPKGLKRGMRGCALNDQHAVSSQNGLAHLTGDDLSSLARTRVLSARRLEVSIRAMSEKSSER
ncbi:hypothetical protein NX059_004654 [Plenodomus lindquistii]|nr:hypothetical protein NX059_004654 [Plenodomus lindquistii]